MKTGLSASRWAHRALVAAWLCAMTTAAGTVHGSEWPFVLLYQKDGAAAYYGLGYSVAGAGDVNGDGYADFIIGAIGANSAYVHSGLNGSLLYQKYGAAASDQFGWSVAGTGDVDGDGRADFIIGAPYADPGARADAGSAYVYSGANGLLLYQKDGAAAGDNLGRSVAGAVDVNGDGKGDFIVGAPYADPGGRATAGSAYVYSGVNGTLLYQKDGAAAGDALGSSVAGSADVTGDGRADFIIGAVAASPGGRWGAGSVYVYSGLSGSLLYQKDGVAAGDNFGLSVAGAGDVNGDGYADFIIGAGYADPGGRSDAGSVYLYSGQNESLLYQKDGAAAGDRLGNSVAGVGDVNGDGKADFIIGADFADPGGHAYAGSAYVYSGLDGALLFQKDGEAANHWLGYSVASAGDINGDGRADFIIGVYGANPGGRTDAGSAYVFQSGYREQIVHVTDVGNDQGRRVRIQWLSHPGADNFVKDFAIYRRIGAYKSGEKAYDPYGLKDTPPGDWDYVLTVPARGDTLYSTEVPTDADSTITDGMYWSVFFVSAIGDNPTDHFDSPPDSGHSKDNLAPAPPIALVATAAGTDVDLDWRSVAEDDFDYYWVYRDIVPGFIPVPSTRVGATCDSSFLDQSVPAGGTVYYKIRAVDFSGNEGDPSNEAAVTLCSCPCHGDPQCDGLPNVQDVVQTVNVAFRGSVPVSDPDCPRERTDVNCDNVTTVQDVVKVVNVAFRGANPATEFCDPCAP
ncbi:MAG: integrin alpha [Candidatus Zixiibacteriota bacterium]